MICYIIDKILDLVVGKFSGLFSKNKVKEYDEFLPEERKELSDRIEEVKCEILFLEKLKEHRIEIPELHKKYLDNLLDHYFDNYSENYSEYVFLVDSHIDSELAEELKNNVNGLRRLYYDIISDMNIDILYSKVGMDGVYDSPTIH